MAYASASDLTMVGMPAVALGQLSTPQINAALQNASDFADTFFRGRYGNAAVPLVQWDSAVTEAVAKVAAYRLIMIRGYNPSSGSDLNFRQMYDDAIAWLDKVQRQQAHPNVTVASSPLPGSVQPQVISSSVVNLASGCSRPNRGW